MMRVAVPLLVALLAVPHPTIARLAVNEAQSPKAKPTSKQSSAAKDAARLKLQKELANLKDSALAITHNVPLNAVPKSVTRKKRGVAGTVTKKITSAGDIGAVADDIVTAGIAVSENMILLNIENNTDSTMRLLWDEAAFIDTDAVSHRLVRGGTRIIDRNASQPPSVIPPHAEVREQLFPTDLVEWKDGEWKYETILTRGYRKDVGSTVRVFVPLEIDGSVYDYTFNLEVTVSPELLDKAREAEAQREEAEKLLSELKVGMMQDEVVQVLGAAAVSVSDEIVNNERVEEWRLPSKKLKLRFDAFGKLLLIERLP